MKTRAEKISATNTMRLPIVAATIMVVALASCGGGSDEPIPVEPDGGIGDGAGPPPGTGADVDLEITIDHPDVDAYAYRIICDGETATIEGSDAIDAEEACNQLSQESVQERLAEGPPADRVCTEIYGGPDTATIVGSIDGRSVDTVFDRVNGCGIAEWDELLGDVLPPAIGVGG